ncbi:MAG TPA: M28 family peptidase [Saprospiraceae bacterium]|nr:M28 family peptidase [Saprospiraceae bacterium]
MVLVLLHSDGESKFYFRGRTKYVKMTYRLGIIIVSFGFLGGGFHLAAQDDHLANEAFRIKSLYETALRSGQSYIWLRDMAMLAGHRLTGSEGAAVAVEYAKQVLDTLGLDSVWLQPCKVPRWTRGEKEIVRIRNSSSMGTVELHALALGNSVGSGPHGVEAEVIEVLNLDSLRLMPESQVRGKIVFFNRPMDETLINTFHAYGRAVDQRWAGPKVAAGKGAVGAIVRSMTTSMDDIPHTGSTEYSLTGSNIPAVAISTHDAELLGNLLERETVRLYIRTTCMMLDSVISHNVIGQIKGQGRPDEIILVGGHLDSWDVGHGAHDDGSGCMQAMDVMYLLRISGYVPQRTIRCVLFMNEENGLAGAKAYAENSNKAGEFHLAAIESDAGGFRPLGFGCSSQSPLQEAYLRSVNTWWNLLEPYGLMLSPGGGGADIGPLRSQGGMLFGMRVDSQRYFDYHHTHEDTIDKVHPRELKIGAAAMASLVTLLDSFAVRVYE